jgi:hypothetical protein
LFGSPPAPAPISRRAQKDPKADQPDLDDAIVTIVIAASRAASGVLSKRDATALLGLDDRAAKRVFKDLTEARIVRPILFNSLAVTEVGLAAYDQIQQARAGANGTGAPS